MNHFTRLLPGAAVIAVLTVLSGPGLAGDIPDGLRRQAVEACTSDALRLCPATLPNEQETIACMAGQRSQLRPACGHLYDRVFRLLKR